MHLDAAHVCIKGKRITNESELQHEIWSLFFNFSGKKRERYQQISLVDLLENQCKNHIEQEEK